MTPDDDFVVLFQRRARDMRRVAYLLCGDWTQAEDLTQTAFAKLYASWSRLRDPVAADAFLRTTLTRTYIDASKRAWRREQPTLVLPDRPDPAAHSPEDRMVVLDVLAGVPPRQRACLVLRYFLDCSVEDTAAALGCSTGTVKSNTSRGLDAMRRVLGDDLVTSERNLL